MRGMAIPPLCFFICFVNTLISNLCANELKHWPMLIAHSWQQLTKTLYNNFESILKIGDAIMHHDIFFEKVFCLDCAMT